jgi:predicted nucleic acid-binding protein
MAFFQRISWMEAHGFLELLRSLLMVLPVTPETHEAGLALAERYGLSTYDAMIAASALQGCLRYALVGGYAGRDAA